QISQVARQVWINTKAFLTKAGTVIFCLSVILWAMAYYPRLPADRAAAARASARTVYMSTTAGVSEPFQQWTYTDYLADLRTEKPFYPRHATETEIAREIDRIELEAKSAEEKATAAAQSEYSLSGRLGHLMEPAIRPLGYDWKIGIGLVSAFAAREVFVSSMGIVYSVGQVEEG